MNDIVMKRDCLCQNKNEYKVNHKLMIHKYEKKGLKMNEKKITVNLEIIGWVKHNYSDEEIKQHSSDKCGEIIIDHRFLDGLKGIDGFSHLILIAYLNKVSEDSRRVLVVKPKRLVKLGFSLDELPEVGVFATDSPHRPNPISVTIVRVEKIEENIIKVCGLDLYNDTPVIDIKPYTPSRIITDIKLPEWYTDLERKIDMKIKGKVDI